ncbi:hypothetical protein ILUMI_12121 [Ignelater luminosus]|uniref:Uncharacterized protein n=1 Tax=Ignelater luminosus TaxID=2038154 RepID=A0A8K0CYT2_IGNLU|nr:hypothetical protein ILUMI_12121 [Ignelater luminosus]
MISSESNFVRLEKCGKFNTLRTLDLSDNDIYNLKDVLEALKSLKMLSGLSLEGNPCATCIAYKDAVLLAMPHLIYLDNTQILDEDRRTNPIFEKYLNSAALIFTCHRIMGLPPTPKLAGVTQTIHVEINLPLLEKIILESPAEVRKEDSNIQPSKKVETKKSKTDQKPKDSKKGKDISIYDAEDEYKTEVKLNLKDTSFKTERMPWDKIITFPEEAIVVESPENNLTMIRDTFRSTVNVKIVYLKIQLPEKSGNADSKDKKRKNSKNITVEFEKSEEKILQKVTLANFYCDLHNVNWSDKTIDFYWADHNKCTPKAIPIEGSLRAINYVEGKDKKDIKPMKTQEVIPNAQEVQAVPSKQFLPNIFTCQIGFGLKRSFPVS